MRLVFETLFVVVVLAVITTAVYLPASVRAALGLSSLGLMLTEAAQRGDVADVQAALAQGASAREGAGSDALACAASSGNIAVINQLLASGADVNGSAAFTPLMAAAIAGRVDAVEVLLQAGAEVDFELYQGGSALSAAAQMGHAQVVDMLLQYGAGLRHPEQLDRALVSAASANDRPEVLSYLLEADANCNATDDNGKCALQLAIEANCIGNVQVLLAADPPID